ncbi:DUF1905 domain-containing protein [Aridibaculum aurantiacum]|uniref:DUF1905 domain-containing protein n=1 Tax=Aridibaculum aurantiacum TaxID=2810307 RepID=UPI001A9596DE|nr:DUF1905 domain-containing protein [Aridibaculum aurantiacum]
MTGKIEYAFTGSIWQHLPAGGWHFVSLPSELSTEIRNNLKSEEEGWGRLKARAAVGASNWDTAIWFDTKRGTYLLPIKADIRKKQLLTAGDQVQVVIWI